MPPLVITALLLLAAYLLGSVSGCLVLGRARGVDIRQQGSGNAGGTNALRKQGWKFALGAALVDVGKGVLATWIALHWAPVGVSLSVTAHGYLAAGAAMVGHVWPLWHGFRGGKGAAPLIGGLLVLWPSSLLLILLAWGGMLVSTGFVSLSTVIAVGCLPVLARLTDANVERMWFSIAAALFIAFTHRSNVQRLRDGSESRFARARLLHRLHRRKRS